MAWTIEVSEKAFRALRKMDKQTARRIRNELSEIAKLEDPRSRGKALTGNLAGVWRYRVGDYRILCDINDGRLVILVVDVAHRREGANDSYCPWCTPYRRKALNDIDTVCGDMSLIDGVELSLETIDGHGAHLKMSHDNDIDRAWIPINYCPICGRSLRKDV